MLATAPIQTLNKATFDTHIGPEGSVLTLGSMHDTYTTCLAEVAVLRATTLLTRSRPVAEVLREGFGEREDAFRGEDSGGTKG